MFGHYTICAESNLADVAGWTTYLRNGTGTAIPPDMYDYTDVSNAAVGSCPGTAISEGSQPTFAECVTQCSSLGITKCQAISYHNETSMCRLFQSCQAASLEATPAGWVSMFAPGTGYTPPAQKEEPSKTKEEVEADLVTTVVVTTVATTATVTVATSVATTLAASASTSVVASTSTSVGASASASVASSSGASVGGSGVATGGTGGGGAASAGSAAQPAGGNVLGLIAHVQFMHLVTQGNLGTPNETDAVAGGLSWANLEFNIWPRSTEHDESQQSSQRRLLAVKTSTTAEKRQRAREDFWGVIVWGVVALVGLAVVHYLAQLALACCTKIPLEMLPSEMHFPAWELNEFLAGFLFPFPLLTSSMKDVCAWQVEPALSRCKQRALAPCLRPL